MRMRPLIFALAGLCAFGAQAATPARDSWRLPIESKTFPNGLTVVVSEDHSSPTFGMSVVYHVGMRLEPQNRTGFAHLFEHLMFEGTPNAPKGTFDRVIQGGGGINNGSTRADFTNYIETAPVSALEPILWLEADRMKTLDFSEKNLKNQQEVVKEEIRVNVKNKPYGLFFWTDVIAMAFTKWSNNHDGYGSFEDLDHAQLNDVEAFHRAYYGPNNAVIGVAGDVKAADVFKLVEKYFAAIPSREKPAKPDTDEPLNTTEHHAEQTDPLARVPALAVAWKMPSRGEKDQAAAEVFSQILAGGDASRLYQGLVKGRELLLNLNGGLNFPLGDAWDYDGRAQFTLFALYKPNADAAKVLGAIDEEVAKIAKDGVSAEELARTKTELLSNYYSGLQAFISRADQIAKAQTIWGDAKVVNQIPDWIEAVQAADVQRVASTYATTPNRTWIDRKPAPAAAAKK